jgi:hypothetical protein
MEFALLVEAFVAVAAVAVAVEAEAVIEAVVVVAVEEWSVANVEKQYSAVCEVILKSS